MAAAGPADVGIGPAGYANLAVARQTVGIIHDAVILPETLGATARLSFWRPLKARRV